MISVLSKVHVNVCSGQDSEYELLWRYGCCILVKVPRMDIDFFH